MELWARKRWEGAQHLDETELDQWRQAIAEKLEL